MDAIKDKWKQHSNDMTQGYEWKEGLPYHEQKIVIPQNEELKQRVIGECHDSCFHGHVGRYKTLELLQRLF